LTARLFRAENSYLCWELRSIGQCQLNQPERRRIYRTFFEKALATSCVAGRPHLKALSGISAADWLFTRTTFAIFCGSALAPNEVRLKKTTALLLNSFKGNEATSRWFPKAGETAKLIPLPK
jgi:hypothetical protein